MAAASMLGVLQARLATLPGGRDLEGRPLVLINVPTETQPWDKEQLDSVLKYFASILSQETRRNGLTVIVDAQRGAWRLARSCLRQVGVSLGSDVATLLMVRPDAFWDKQRVDNCARSHKQGEPLYIPISRLHKYAAATQLPAELGGHWPYNPHQWIQNRIYVETFLKDAEGSVADLEKLRQRLTSCRAGLRTSSAQEALALNRDVFEATTQLTHKVFQAGKELLQQIELGFLDGQRRGAREVSTPQDVLDSRDKIDRLLEIINVKQIQIEEAWLSMEKQFVDAREVTSLEDGVTQVTNWILGTAETLLNAQYEVGFDVLSAEELRQEHEKLELQCRETYGHYAELLHKIDSLPQSSIDLPDDLKSQRDFMNFVCRSFATRLERRRNVLITSLRFFRLVSEYFDRTSEVFETLVKRNTAANAETAETTLHQLQESQINIDYLEQEVLREGERLADILSMPVKDALGRDVHVNYENDIANVHDILDATVARKNIFCDSLDLQRLTLQQVTHVFAYEQDAAQAAQWLDDLYQVMLKSHLHVGCNVYEIQAQKDEHQTFQDTAKGTYEYGGQLLTASLALRQSCKLPIDGNNSLSQKLWHSWKRLQTIGQEQMTRLRVSAVFHRSVEEHCKQLRTLIGAVKAMEVTEDAEDATVRRSRIHKFLTGRERLLLEVGRMVRLGRLLRTRLREPLSQDGSGEVSDCNETAVEAISDRLAEVTGLAEELDAALCGAQHDPSSPVSPNIKKILDGTASTTPEDWYSSLKTSSKSSAEDSKSEDEFVTASECTCTPPSRSSSFHTASECGGAASPWWEPDPASDADDEQRPRRGEVKPVVRTTTEITSDIIVHEVTETTQLRLSHNPSLGVTSFHLTSDVTRTGESPEVKATPAAAEGGDVAGSTPPSSESERPLSTDEELLAQLTESREYLQLKVVEVTPELTQLGSSLQEAEQLLRAHDEVLAQLQSKQSPVEELLRQADQLISTQRPRAEVYAAMAESLGLAWQDVNHHLEQRKHILDLNVAYQSRAEDCMERMLGLEIACRQTTPPFEVDAVKELLTELHDLRRGVLASLMAALKDGKALLETVKGVAALGTLDSRPDQIRTHAEYATSKVEHWLEELHDRRRLLDISWQTRKTQLEQCLALALLAIDLRELEDTLALRRDALVRSGEHLGDSASSAELLLSEHRKLTPEAKELQDRGLRVTKATEQIVGAKHYAGDQATAKAYDVLSECAEYLDAIEQRENLLKRVIAFFHQAHTALTKLDQLEVQLTTTELSSTSPSLAQLHAQASRALEDITEEPLQEGYSLMEAVGRGTRGTEGVKHCVEEIENRKIHLEGLCTAHREEHLRISQALTSFLEKQNLLFSWLVSVCEAFLQGHQDMGSVLPMAEDFLQMHRQLLAEHQTKGSEINVLLLTLPPILEYLTDEQRHDVDEKVENLHSQWVHLKQLLEVRVDLATEYVKFHTLAVKLSNAFDEVEEMLRNTANSDDQDAIAAVEQKWLVIQQMYIQLDNQGKAFIELAVKASDPYLDVKRAALCVETLLEHFGGRQLTITSSFETWQTTITHEREFKVLWERNVSESRRTVDWVSKLDAQLYPVLTGDPRSPSKVVVRELEDQLNFTLPELKRALAEIELRVKTAESLAQKGDPSGHDNLESKLIELNTKLHGIFTEYQILVQMLISYFKNLAELEKTIENLESQYRLTLLPHSISEVELLVKEHEASRQAILELFKFTNSECLQLIVRVREQEPAKCAAHDEDRLRRQLELRREEWEAAWMERKAQLEQHLELCHFDGDLHQINTTLNDLGKQLTDVRGQYGESLASAKATSSAFVYFEKTIEVLESRIQTFVSTAEAMLTSEHVSSPHIERELTQLNNRWSAFRRQVTESRRLINLSIQYFTLVEEAEEWFKEGGKLLVMIARKSTGVKRPEEASQLLQDVETFLKPGEARQDERIKKISRLAIELYGEERSKQVTLVLNENREMMDSFTVISEELIILSRNLKLAEEQRDRQKKEQVQQDATLAEARAEVAAAKAAASAADEARQAAEAAAQTLRDAVPPQLKTVDVGVEALPPAHAEMQTSTSPPPMEEVPEPVEVLPKFVPPMFVIPLYDSDIQEGERFTFECCVTGVPTPDIIWYKDGISIQNNPDYATTYVDGRCSLTIEETFTEDSAKFTCTAGNVAGIAETSALLSVSEAELEEMMSAPEFTKHLQPSFAKEGSSFQLEVKVQGHPLPTVQWFKDGVCIDQSADYSISYNNGVGIVRFEEVFLEDQAEYTCKAVNQMGSATSTANLNVQPLEPTEGPMFLTPLSNVMARAGQKVKLECSVSGLPTPEVAWTHDGKPVKETRDLTVQFEDKKNASLVITEAYPKDAGVYAVTASNVAGEVTSSCNVTVKGRLPTETSDSELASDLEPIKPAVQLQLKDVSVFEGKRVQLDCIIVGLPEPEVIWYHDERPVKESPEFKLLFQGDRCSLIINEVYLEDAGEYKVVAINSGGEASSKCQLTVQSMSQTEPAMRPSAAPAPEEVPQGTAPKFSKLLTDVLAAQGDKVAFECCVSGDPRPDIRWYLNNQEIQPKGTMEFGEDAEGNVCLTLTEAQPENKGVYTVKASNAFGDAKCFATLIVKASVAPETVKQEEKLVPPAFRELFADRNVYEDEITKFECIVTGKPTPKVQWCFNDKPVSGGGFLASTSGERQVLTIPRVTPDRVGKISCVAENEAGKASCVAILKIMQDALPTSLVPVESSTVSEQIDSSSFTMKRSVFVQSSSSHVTSSTTQLGAEPNVQMHSYTSDSMDSMQQVGKKPAVQIQTMRTEEIHQVNQEKPEVHSQSVMKITNGEEVHEVKVVPVKTKPQRKSVAPRFMTPLNGKIVDQGSDVVFEGIIDGYPQPEVTWTKNGHPLASDGDKVTTSWSHNKARLELTGVAVKDAGRYTCKAENEVGTASSTADLVVKKTIFPPVFGRRLQAQMVKVGERVNVEVEVTGTPEPTVTWYKDGEQILGTSPGGKFRTKVQGNCYMLIIEKATLDHSGKYMVRAVNEGGEAQSIADFLVYEPQADTTIDVVKHLVFEDVTHHTTQQRVEHKGTGVPMVPEVYAPPPQAPPTDFPLRPETITISSSRRSPSPFTSESLNITESMKTEKHVTIRMDRAPSPSLPRMPEKPPTPVFHQTPEEVLPPAIEEPKIVQIPIVTEEKPKSPEPVPEQTVSLPEPEIDPPQENEGVETASITKQTAFDFFFAKLHENDNKPEQQEKQAKLPVYQKPTASLLEETVTPMVSTVHKRETSSSSNIDFFNKQPQFGTSVFDLQPAHIVSENVTTQQTSSFIGMSQSSSSFVEEFNLQAEPPPEMGFFPKSDLPSAYKEDVTTRVKRLEECTRVLSPVEIPTGAVRIFPVKLEPLNQEAMIKTSEPPPVMWPPQQEVQEEVCVKEEIGTRKVYTTGGMDGTIPPENKVNYRDKNNIQEAEALIFDMIEEQTVKPQTPARDTEQIMQSLPFLRPQAEIIPRPTSPRPSAEGVSMEKLWATRRTPEPDHQVHEETKPAEIWRAISPKPTVQTFGTDNLWSSSYTSTQSETLSSSTIGEIKRAVSPRPSAQGVAMEKLWTPLKPSEPDTFIQQSVVKAHGDKDRPSTDGLKMDKIWAHKHKTSGLKKSWPPQQDTEEKTGMMWSSKGPEKVSPSVPVDTVVHVPNQTTPEKLHIEESVPQQVKPEPTFQFINKPQGEYFHQATSEKLHIQEIVPQQVKPEPTFQFMNKQQGQYFHSVKNEVNESSTTSSQSYFEPPQFIPQNTQHYIAEARVSHSSSLPPMDEIITNQSTTTSEFKEFKSNTFEKTEFYSGTSQVDSGEERNIKPSEAKKIWPPIQKEEPVFKPTPQIKEKLPPQQQMFSPLPTRELFIDEPFLEPGAPPEFGIAHPPLERRLSYKETVEMELEKDLQREPSRHLAGAVRILPPPKERVVAPPLPPKEATVIGPPVPPKAVVAKPIVKPIPTKEIKPLEMKFERFPDLEPFPFQPEAPKSKPSKCPPPPQPSKFTKGEFTTSEYDSDMDSGCIPPKWRPCESDSEELGFRKVRPPSTTPQSIRPASTDPEPLPPSRFDNPPRFEGPPRPSIEKVQVKKDVKTTNVKVEKKKHHQHHHHQSEEKRKISPPNIKPGSPPIYVQAVAPPKPEPKSSDSPIKICPESPKKVKLQESGYMADTDEPRTLLKQTAQKSSKCEETSVRTTVEHFTQMSENVSSESSYSVVRQNNIVQETALPQKPHPITKPHHRHQEPRKVAPSQPVPKKVLIPSAAAPQVERPLSLEPFPFSANAPSGPKRPMGPPPPSPSKFMKGEFRDSEYESDYDGRIPPRWCPDGSDTDSLAFKPVHPVLTPNPQSRSSMGGRTPTPPTEFDEPPQFGGPPRPKFEPIEKQPTVKLQEILKPANKQQKVFKPKPVTAQSLPPMEVIIATPAVKEVLGIKPGSPPELGFAPRRSSGYHNATHTETSNVVNFAESTEHSRRVVSVQQTTRVIKFGEKENKETNLEPFPYKPDPVVNQKRQSGPPLTMPKKFFPGEFRESDYESEVENIHFKPKWIPGENERDDLHYRKVQPLLTNRSASVPVKCGPRVQTPMEFDTQPPVLTTTATSETRTSQMTSTTTTEYEAEQKRLKRVEEMRQRFGEKKTPPALRPGQTQEVVLSPGSPPEIAYSPGKIPPAASYAASRHMNQMTSEFKTKAQQFVNDIITDVESSRKPDKPILKTDPSRANGADEPQAYREESRLAEYGTKHIDPDTGLIYFKYDFGYEFGIVLPGEGKKAVEGADKTKKRPRAESKKQPGDIDFPVIHEKTTASKKIPQFRPKKFTHVKAVKWEPASESEMSENEESMQHKKRYSLPQPTSAMMQILIPGASRWDQPTPSPVSLSPSLPSLSPYCSSQGPQSNTPLESSGTSPWAGANKGMQGKGRGSTPTPPSTPSTPRSTPSLVVSSNQPQQPRRPPNFITPLRDIAVVSGQSARFECIVQAEPLPNVLWSKNGRILENSHEHVVEFRNGVCRLTIPQAYIDSAGEYTCTATNLLGTIGTTATLQVPGERRFKK